MYYYIKIQNWWINDFKCQWKNRNYLEQQKQILETLKDEIQAKVYRR